MSELLKAEWPAPENIKTACIKRELIENLSLPAIPFWLNQTHSNIVTQHSESQDADAVITKNSEHICAVLTADCLPVLICNKQGNEVAAIHAGWRSIFNDIIPNTIEKMKSDPKDLLIWFGPAIGPEVYEVDQEFHDNFLEKNPNNKTCFTQRENNKWLANLYQLANIQLETLGIEKHYGGTFCTYSDPRFYSYRRNQAQTGRMASLIWID